MKLANCLAGAGIALMFAFAAPSLWGQATEPGSVGATSVAPKAASPTAPPERVAPGVPGIPANTAKPAGPVAGNSHPDAMNPDYVAKKIADAAAHGKDVTKARSEQAKGNAALKKGMNDEAARHFDSALRLIGDMAAGVGGSPGPDNSVHLPMPGAVTPADQMPGKVTPVEARRG
jgi:hypothetical protein